MVLFYNSVRIIKIRLPCNYAIAVHASHYLSLTYEYNMTASMVQLLKNNPSQLKHLKLLPAITARLLLIYPGPQASEIFAPVSQHRLFLLQVANVTLSSSRLQWKDAHNKVRVTRAIEMPLPLCRNEEWRTEF